MKSFPSRYFKNRQALIKPLLALVLIGVTITAGLLIAQRLFVSVPPKPLTTQEKLISTDPMIFAEGLVELQGSEELKQYVCCEALSLGEEYVQGYAAFFKEIALPEYQTELLLLDKKDGKALVSLEVSKENQGENWYLYLTQKQYEWRLDTMRSLALTGMYQQIITSYEDATEEQRQVMREHLGNAQFNMMYRTAKLITATDSKIAQHFFDNKDRYQDLLVRVRRYEIISGGTLQMSDHDKDVMNELAISFTSTGDYAGVECDNCYFFLIGGMVDNAVGYAYIPYEEEVPFPDGREFIMFRSLGDGWYIYKTT